MKRTNLLILAVAVVVSAVLIAGCKGDRTMISRILERPERYMDHSVNIAGEVTRTYSVNMVLAEVGAYQVDDGSGRMWVLTRTGAPREGARVGLRGHVESGVKLGREIFGVVIREEDRRVRGYGRDYRDDRRDNRDYRDDRGER